jgi:DNA segregation ATPase FtsK/SpoIIIE-like protein
MHLILATQRPSADIISGLIRSNILGRIALKTDKAIESGIILDRNGAETLTGKGEMLVKLPGFPDLVRCQGSFIDDENMEAIVKWWSENCPGVVPVSETKSRPKIVFDHSDSGDEEKNINTIKHIEQNSKESSVEYLLKYSICKGLIDNGSDIEITIPTFKSLVEEFKDIASEWEVRQTLDKLKQEGWIQTIGSKKGTKNIVTLDYEKANEWISETGN